jgi:hypothetical protein
LQYVFLLIAYRDYAPSRKPITVCKMDSETKARAGRLQHARKLAGYATPAEFLRDYPKIKQPTYSGHENATRGIRPRTADEYAAAFGNCTGKWIMYGGDDGAPYSVAARKASSVPPSDASNGPASFSVELGQRLAFAINARNMEDSLAEIAARLGWSSSDMSAYLSGSKSIGAEDLVKFAKLVLVKPSFFTEGHESALPEKLRRLWQESRESPRS